MFLPHNNRDSSSRHLSRTSSGKPLSEDEKRARLREAGRRKLDMFKQRQLQELQRNEHGRFANLLSMVSPLPTHETQHDAAAEQMGSPMSGRQHARRSSDWSVSNQPSNEPRASQNSIEMAARPKIQPVFRPIKKQPAAEDTQSAAAEPKAADGHEEMVQILLQQVAQLQAEKQEVLRRCSALELDNENLQELVGFLSESAELSPTDGSLEVGEHDLEEVYTVIVEGDAVQPDSPAAAAAAPARQWQQPEATAANHSQPQPPAVAHPLGKEVQPDAAADTPAAVQLGVAAAGTPLTA